MHLSALCACFHWGEEGKRDKMMTRNLATLHNLHKLNDYIYTV